MPRAFPTGESSILYTCSLDDGGPKLHPCRDVFDKNRPFGLFTKGKRPQLKEMTGQEKPPVLQLPTGEFVTGSGRIIDWPRATLRRMPNPS